MDVHSHYCYALQQCPKTPRERKQPCSLSYADDALLVAINELRNQAFAIVSTVVHAGLMQVACRLDGQVRFPAGSAVATVLMKQLYASTVMPILQNVELKVFT
eukprot:392799-Amphidinium_carterae.1